MGHERDAVALDGVEDDAGGAAADVARPAQRRLDGVEVVAVDAAGDGPAEGLVLLVEGLGAHRGAGEVVVLDAVAVDERDQAVDAVVGGGHGGLPDLAFFLLAVAHEHPDGGVGGRLRVAEARGEAHAEAEREAHAERAGRVVHTGGAAADGVALQPRAEAAEGRELLDGEVAELGEQRVLDGRGVALAHDEAVAAGPVGAVGVVIHDAAVERGHDLDGGERAADVAGAGLEDHAHDVAADAPCQRGQIEVASRADNHLAPASPGS